MGHSTMGCRGRALPRRIPICAAAWAALPMTVASLACGGSGAEEPSAEASHTGDERPRRDDGMMIEGLMGTLSAMEIDRALSPRMNRFASCFSVGADVIETVGGRIEMSFRIATDGSVKWVFAKASTVGERQTERCLLEVAAATRFSRPHGGEAEFSWPLEFDPPEDVRAPDTWSSTEIADLLAAEGSGVTRACIGGRGQVVEVTAYVASGGAVLSVGAASTERAEASQLDCVAEAVRQWTFPDPGSYQAKVTFELR